MAEKIQHPKMGCYASRDIEKRHIILCRLEWKFSEDKNEWASLWHAHLAESARKREPGTLCYKFLHDTMEERSAAIFGCHLICGSWFVLGVGLDDAIEEAVFHFSRPDKEKVEDQEAQTSLLK